jgi:hypothetical protein
MQEYTRVQNLGYCARQSAFHDNPAAKRSVPKVVKPLWAALRGRDTAISQRQGKKDGKHYDNSRIGFGRRWIQMRRLEPAFDGFSPF